MINNSSWHRHQRFLLLALGLGGKSPIWAPEGLSNVQGLGIATIPRCLVVPRIYRLTMRRWVQA